MKEELKSQTIITLIRNKVKALYPELNTDGMKKVEILTEVLQRGGVGHVRDIGYEIRHFTNNPVFQAVLKQTHPMSIIQRWIKLEKFGHMKNRTRILSNEEVGSLIHIQLEHYSIDDNQINSVNDYFVWGMYLGLMHAADIEVVSANMIQSGSSTLDILEERPCDSIVPEQTRILQLGCYVNSDEDRE